MNWYEYRNNENAQTHTHEFLGSTVVSGRDPHEHRFAGISSEVIPVPGGHIHEILTGTDFYEKHLHRINNKTGIQIPVGNNRHIHYLKGTTTFDDDHTHDFQATTLIENPMGH